jgi:antitoxin HicB
MITKDSAYYLGLPYRVEAYPDEESRTFTLVVPDLKGCMAYGETLEEAYEMLTEAKKLWIETALDEGWDVPEPSTKDEREYSGRFNVRLPRYLHRDLATLADAEGTSLNQLVVGLLASGL